ncbi:MAG: hypothetical protein PHY18_01835 [Dehalococcoidales bacterium]|nr:hypothetical protein [Dehalococcoidales bacterium]
MGSSPTPGTSHKVVSSWQQFPQTGAGGSVFHSVAFYNDYLSPAASAIVVFISQDRILPISWAT